MNAVGVILNSSNANQNAARSNTRAYDILALGEAMVEFNQTQAGQADYVQGFGGDTSNAMIAAARAGKAQNLRCGYISAIGDDVFGQILKELWLKEGLDTAGTAIISGATTGLYFVTHDREGHHFSYRRTHSAAAQMQLNASQKHALQNTRWLHYSGISQAISENAAEQCAQAVKIAKASGGKISYDSNLRLKLWSLSTAKAQMIPAIASCDLFLPSLDDVQLLSDLSQPNDIIAWCHAQGAPQVLLKLGARGAMYSDGARLYPIPAMAVTAVDATGAGDCFAGNFLARFCLGDDALVAAQYANAAAALSVQGFGAVAPLPYAQDVLRLLNGTRLS